SLLSSIHSDLLDLYSFPTRRSSDLIIWIRYSRRTPRIRRSSKRYSTPRFTNVSVGWKDWNRICTSLGECGRRARYFATNPDRSRSEEHTSELQSRENLVCRLLLEKK